MAKLSDLVSVFADHNLDSSGTLNLFSRRLREAGRVSKAKRGNGAAAMSSLDAARFLIALGATDHPERVADIEPFFSGARPRFNNSILHDGHVILREVAENELTFDAAVALLIERSGELGDDASKTFLDVERTAGGGAIYIGDNIIQFGHPTVEEGAQFSTGKNIRATFYADVLVRLRQMLLAKANKQS